MADWMNGGPGAPIPVMKPPAPSGNAILDVFASGISWLGNTALQGLDIYERVEATKQLKKDAEFQRQHQLATSPDAWLFQGGTGATGIPMFWLILAGVIGIAMMARGD